jgi:hypothetical protein
MRRQRREAAPATQRTAILEPVQLVRLLDCADS